jgi:hypothetical protein
MDMEIQRRIWRRAADMKWWHSCSRRRQMDKCGDTTLHSAASGGHEVVVRLLLEKGADIAAENICGYACCIRPPRTGTRKRCGYLGKGVGVCREGST